MGFLLLFFGMPVNAQEAAASDTFLLQEDSLAAYRHPSPIHLHHGATMHKALMAKTCPTDSVITTDYSGAVKTQQYYYYDAAGHVIEEINYSWSNGVRTGISRYKKVYTGSTATTTVNYQWDKLKETWIGKDSTQLIHYASGLLNSSTKYVWENNQWRYDDCYWYEYFNNTDKLIKSLHTKWNTISQQEESVDMYEWIYDNTNSKLLMSAYWVYTNNTPIGKTKTVYSYDSEGRTIIEEKYKGWENGDWKGSEKTSYAYNAYGKVVDQITYKWSSGWKYSKRITQEYNSSKQLIDKANYVWSNNTWTGSSRTSTEYISSIEKAIVIWQWDNSIMDWKRSQRTSTISEGGKTKQQIIQYWDGEKWVNYSLVQNTYTAKNLTLSYIASWNGMEWKDSLQTIYDYNNATLILQVSETSNGQQWVAIDSMKRDLTYATIAGKDLLISDSTMVWSASSNKWLGQSKTVNVYDINGNVLTIDTYTFVGNRWIPDQHTENGYKDDKGTLMIYTFTMLWNGNSNKWEAAGPKMEYEYDDNNKRVGSATYRWDGSNSKWIGVSRSYEVYVSSALNTKYVYQWNTVTESWTYSTRIEYEYSNNQKVTETTSIYNSQQASWTYSEREQYEYDIHGTLIGTKREIWKEDWCTLSLEKEHFDTEVSGGRLRYSLKEEYTNCELTSYIKKNYFYSCDPCIIRFVNYDGTELESKTLDKGVTPSYSGDTPTKPEDAEYTYTFLAWTPAIVPVAGNATYTATFKATKRSYTITWLNDDDSQIDQTTVEYGIMPTHANPTKENTAEYTYTFTGWTPGIGVVTGEATYKATFSETKNKYTITWLNDDDSQIDQTTVAYGETPIHADAEKANTAEWTYTFAGWDPEVVSVTGNATYKATFNATKNSYTITWKNEDGSVIESETLEYGVMPQHTDPSKDNTAEWTYSFSGWTPEIASVTGNAEYTATFSATKNKYTITFLNYDGTELQSGEVEYGVKPTYEGAIPAKPEDDEFHYAFAGWDKEIVEVGGPETYTATFSTTTNEYTITWYNDDNTLIDQTTVAYGVVPTHEDPTKENTAEWTYTFSGWDHEPVAVTGAASYTAVFTATKNSYTITWLNEDGDEIEHEILEHGKTPEHTAPAKENTAEWTYTFTGWTPAIESVKGDASYKATFSATKNSYTIKFLNYNGEVLQSTNVEYGVKPVYEGDIPAKPEDDEFHYAFAGWDKEIVEVGGPETYTATFSTTTNEYTISWFNDDNTLIDQTTVAYGVVPTHDDPTKENTAEFTYTFSGWDHDPVAVTGNSSYTATYNATKNKYLVVFQDEGGTELQSGEVEYGTTPTYEGEKPHKDADVQYTYTFSGWDPEITAVESAQIYTAKYNSTVNSYTITWLNEDGSEISHETLEYGVTPTHADIYKESTEKFTYTFIGWTPSIVPVNGDAAYKAVFEATPIDHTLKTYTITFLHDDGITILEQVTVEYGEIPVCRYTPTKMGDAEHYYTFIGWSPEIVPYPRIYRRYAYPKRYDAVCLCLHRMDT